MQHRDFRGSENTFMKRWRLNQYPDNEEPAKQTPGCKTEHVTNQGKEEAGRHFKSSRMRENSRVGAWE